MSPREPFRIFVASPRDVNHLRDATRTVIKSMNAERDEFDATFKPFMWEYDASPDQSVDVQGLINAQAGVKFDIFLGLFWHRFGSPTARAKSGFAEEYLRAIRLFRKAHPELKIWMCHFAGKLSPSEIDHMQHKALQAFIKQHGRTWLMFGGRPGAIDSVIKFRKELRTQLTRFIEQSQRRRGAKRPGRKATTPAAKLFKAAAHPAVRPLKPSK